MDIEKAVETAHAAADAAARAAMCYFRKDLDVELKDDLSPVTVADKEAEAAILDVIRGAFPDHDVIAEETGLHERGSRYRWIVDPLDGTRGFSRGSTFWGPLIALEHEGDILAGALGLPALGMTYYGGRGIGSYRNGQRLAVSAVDDWSQAILSLGELSRLLREPYRDGVIALATTATSARCYGDLAAATLLLDGRAEAWVEAGVKIWDVAPMRVLVEEAGGTFTDIRGGADLDSGTAIATNGRLHAHVRAAFA